MNWYKWLKIAAKLQSPYKSQYRPQIVAKPHGYWVLRDGEPIPVPTLDHEGVAIRNGLGKDKADALRNGNLHVTTSPTGVGVAFDQWPTPKQYQTAQSLMANSGFSEWDVNGPNFAAGVTPEAFDRLMKTRRLEEGAGTVIYHNNEEQLQKMRERVGIDDIAYTDIDEDDNPWTLKKAPPKRSPEEMFLQMLNKKQPH